MNDEVYFWQPHKHQSLLQVHTIIFGICNKACLKYSKYIWNIFGTSLKRIEDEVAFLLADRH